MNRRKMLQGMGTLAIAGLAATPSQASMDDDTVYELRVYHLNEGKLPLILERFRTKETQLFTKCGMHGVAYWTPTDEPLAGKALIYMVRHKSRDAAKESWSKFRTDPEWLAVKAETEKDGAFVNKVESTFLKLTEFSPKL